MSESTAQTLPRNARVAWIGTGIMGSSMAGHLLKAGFHVTVYSRTKARAEGLLAAGASWASSPALAAKDADFVCTNVALPSEVDAVHFGPDGVLSAAKPGQIFIDFGTSKPSTARVIALEAASKGACAFDAPVSGGDIGARNATLSIMVGGDAATFERAREIFDLLGKTVVYQGEAGAGQRTKIVNQMLVAANTIGMCEAMHFAALAGLDLNSVLESVGGGAAASWSISVLAPRVVNGDFEPGFFVDHLVKDLRIAKDEADSVGASLPIVELCLERYERLVAAGFGRKGTQGIYLLYRGEASGLHESPDKPISPRPSR